MSASVADMRGGVEALVIDDGWESALTAVDVARAGVSYDWLTSVDDRLFWVESSPDAGRDAVVTWSAGSVAVLPGDGVGSGLHAYGGMPYAVLPSGEVVRVNGESGQLTGVVTRSATAHAYGDLTWSGVELLGVREYAGGDDLVGVEMSSGRLRVLEATDGFLASPRVSGDRLAWVRWGRVVMPWDSSEVWTASYMLDGQPVDPVRVAGGPDESAFQPQWGVDGWLYFMSDRTGWWNLYRWRDGRTQPVAPVEAECATAPWESGYANYAMLPDGRMVMTVQRGPVHELAVVSSGAVARLPVPYTSIKPFLAVVGDRVAVIGSSPTRMQEIALVSTDGSGGVEVVRPGVDRGFADVSVPQLLQVESGGAQVTAVLYPPSGDAGPAPMIVRPHAGPTYHSDLRLDGEVQFFTSRGFAVTDVDYRGSTGYGRAFRKALDGQWGRVDVADCRAVAEHLIDTGRAIPGAMFISGASAGGYTALRAVSEEGPFAMAVARSAIVDPQRWTTTAPRFQRPHAAILASPDSAVRADQVRRPVLLLHGVRDEIVHIGDTAALADGLRGLGLLVGMLTLENVGHYVSGTGLVAALEAELDAYRSVLKDAGLPVPG
ncbi:prolyl oligopeptidase family serine peptidase [Actinoplanes sp. NPDC051343]|uniref:S9 family peptidase n=1 Tax=Actinoplanes sp. NPDC051343 TaxID=3363906 RepID=UPI0037A04B2B